MNSERRRRVLPEHMKAKSASDIYDDIRSVDTFLSRGLDSVDWKLSIRPPSMRPSHLAEMTAEDFTEHYPERYLIYKEALRDIRRGSDPEKMPSDKNLPPDVQASYKERIKQNKHERARRLNWLRMMNSLDRYIKQQSTAEPQERPLRPRQFESLKKHQAHFEQGRLSGYSTLPTGFGKTVLFIRMLEAMGARGLVVVPDKDLVEQTLEKFQKFTPSKKIAGISSDSRHGRDEGDDATVITYESFRRRIADGTMDPDDYDLVVLDEVHEALTDLREDPISKCVEKGVPVVGFTATDEYAHDKAVRNMLHHQVDRMSVRDAVEEKLISPFSLIIVEVDIDISSVALNEFGDYDIDALREFFKTNPGKAKMLHEALLRTIEQEFPRERGFVFCSSSPEADLVAQTLRKKEYGAEALTYKTERRDVDGMMFRFRESGTQFLTGVNKIARGIDNEEATVAYGLRPTRSPVKSVQRGGRALRYKPGKHGYVVEFQLADSRHTPMTFADAINDPDIPTKRYHYTSDGRLRDVKEEEGGEEAQFDGEAPISTETSEVFRLDSSEEIPALGEPFSFEQFDNVELVIAEIRKLLEGPFIQRLATEMQQEHESRQLTAVVGGARGALEQLHGFYLRAMSALVYDDQQALRILRTRYIGMQQLITERLYEVYDYALQYKQSDVAEAVELVFEFAEE